MGKDFFDDFFDLDGDGKTDPGEEFLAYMMFSDAMHEDDDSDDYSDDPDDYFEDEEDTWESSWDSAEDSYASDSVSGIPVRSATAGSQQPQSEERKQNVNPQSPAAFLFSILLMAPGGVMIVSSIVFYVSFGPGNSSGNGFFFLLGIILEIFPVLFLYALIKAKREADAAKLAAMSEAERASALKEKREVRILILVVVFLLIAAIVLPFLL